MTKKTTALMLLLLLGGSFGVLYREVIAKLVNDWSIDENYSHGFLVVPIALYFVWERRRRFLATQNHPSGWGLLVVLGSIGLLLAGVLGAEVFTTEISLIGTIAGSVLYLCGWGRLRVMFFPIAFLLLMVPIPAIIFNQITFPLQLLASRFGESALAMCRIPVLREGNVINLANTKLEVIEACSGIRSLITLLTLGVVYGYLMDARTWVRLCLALATIPVAIFANGFRVAGTGVAAHYYGLAAAEGFFHTFSGWLVFVAALMMLFVLYRVLVLLFPPNTNRDLRSERRFTAHASSNSNS